ncbi:MAG: ATP-binding protein [Clostridiaceae bacterium]|nr:ATP-binding protein [Clostridiaceae bacterium]
MNDKQNNVDLAKLLFNCLKKQRENENFDVKLKWHTKIEDLVKDIICFANTINDRNSYIFFGINDDFKIVGLNNEKRRKQADLIDTFSKLCFANSECPSFIIDSLEIEGKIIDVLTIYNVQRTPIFLNLDYGEMRAGCIYSREKDRNTPNKGNSTFSQIENLWKKRFGLIKPQKEILFDLLKNKSEWKEIYPEYYNVFLPDYRIKIIKENTDRDTFYSYVMKNKSTSFYQIELSFNSNKLVCYPGVLLDSGRLFIPMARSSFIKNKESPLEIICVYKYYIKGSEEFSLLNFFYDETDHEQMYALERIMKIFLVYDSELEKFEFENYIENNLKILENLRNSLDLYNYLRTNKESPNYKKFESYREDLTYGNSLNIILKQWREK